MNLKRSFFYSFALHTLLVALLFLIIPAVKEKKTGGEFYTDLVSPEELYPKRRLIMPMPKMRPAPHSRPKTHSPSPAVKSDGKMLTEKDTFRHEPNDLLKSPSTQTDRRAAVEDHKGGQGGFPGANRTDPARSGKPTKPGNGGIPLKDQLFDKGIIGNLAKRNIERDEKKNKTFAFDTSEYKFLIYNQRLKERIESIWVYPRNAAERGIYGDLMIRFTITKNGQLGAVELVRTSGHKDLDDAAIKALRDGTPYWPLPEEWGMEAYTIEGHFVYTIYGYYVR